MKTPRPDYKIVGCCKNCAHAMHGHTGEIYCNFGSSVSLLPLPVAAGTAAFKAHLEELSKWQLENATRGDAVCALWTGEAKS